MSVDSSLSPEEAKKKNTQKALRIIIILAVVTLIELFLAFVWPESVSRTLLNAIFFILTFIKAFFIVAEFMHLKYEVKSLIWAVLAPMAFIVWLLVALWVEGEAIYEAIVRFW